MYYTKAMCDMLKDMGEDSIVFFSHYLDNYFRTLEEPRLESYELKRDWIRLIVDGLCAEINRHGSNYKVAKRQLRKYMILNGRLYDNGDIKYNRVPIMLYEAEEYQGGRTKGYIPLEVIDMIQKGEWR